MSSRHSRRPVARAGLLNVKDPTDHLEKALASVREAARKLSFVQDDWAWMAKRDLESAESEIKDAIRAAKVLR